MDINSGNWIESEFRNLNLKDARLLKRFNIIFKSFLKNAQANISSCFNSWAEVKGSYRFFSNKKVDCEKILNEHIISPWRETLDTF